LNNYAPKKCKTSVRKIKIRINFYVEGASWFLGAIKPEEITEGYLDVTIPKSGARVGH
jgi:hypothetical protein